jgi:hypothetical protein
MNAFELADLAALASLHGSQFAAAEPRTVDQSLAAYWKASRCRLDRWGQHLKSITKQNARAIWSPDASGVVEEIMVCEILVRIVAAVATSHDERHGKAEFAPIGRNILAVHADVRRRALALVNSLTQPSRDRFEIDAEALLALGRQCDRWSDLLLAYLNSAIDVSEFAVSPARVRDFAYDAQQHQHSATSINVAFTMLLAGMRSSLVRVSTGDTPNADLNHEIAVAVLGWFEPALFDSFGLLRSDWHARLASVPNEALARLDEWWQPPPVVSTSSQSARRRW